MDELAFAAGAAGWAAPLAAVVLRAEGAVATRTIGF
jgi:hypothetical protein